MRKIEKILQYLDKEGIKVSAFERVAGLGNSYFNNIGKRGEDITSKMLDRILKNTPDHYYKIFPEEFKSTVEEHHSKYEVKAIVEPGCDEVRIENRFLKQRISDLEHTIKDKNEIIILQRQLIITDTSKSPVSA